MQEEYYFSKIIEMCPSQCQQEIAECEKKSILRAVKLYDKQEINDC